jgi:hypothetical protein
MPEDPHAGDRPAPSPAERHVSRSRIDERAAGRLSNSSIQRERTVESYLRSGVMPRYMERLRDIHAQTEQHRRELAAAHAALREDHGADHEAFARAWRERVETWPFEETNDLIRTHNEWFPVERQLPMDPRTRDYVLIAGRSYRREELTPEWALAQFPAGP